MPEKIPTTNKQELHYKEIGELEEPIREILEQILDKFEKGEYDLMIGIDASGRIPALIIFKVAEYIYKKNGRPLPMFRFVAGHAVKKEIEEAIDKWSPTNKVLIIDDVMESRASTGNLRDVLYQKGLPFDITVLMGGKSRVARFRDIYSTARNPKYFEANMYVAKTDKGNTIHRKDLHGVQKVRNLEASNSFYDNPNDKKYPTHVFSKLSSEFNPDSREDISTVAGHLIDWYSRSQNEK